MIFKNFGTINFTPKNKKTAKIKVIKDYNVICQEFDCNFSQELEGIDNKSFYTHCIYFHIGYKIKNAQLR